MLYVTRVNDIFSGFNKLSVKDITFFHSGQGKNSFLKTSKGVIFHTINDEFFAMGTYDYYFENLIKLGFPFEEVDRYHAIYTPNYSSIDDVKKLIYFDHDKKAVGCPISLPNYRRLITQLSISR